MKKILNSPFIVLPLAAIFLGLVLVPFVVWNVDHAAQFYGSFFAAIVAATAAFSGYFVQNKFTEAREEKAVKSKHTSEIVTLFFRLRYIQVSLARAERVLDKRLNQDDQPDDEHEPFFKLNVVARKAIMMPGIEKDSREYAAKALNLSPKARIVVAGRMYDICEVLENLRISFDRNADLDHEFSAKNLKTIKGIVARERERFRSVTSLVQNHLEKIDAFQELE